MPGWHATEVDRGAKVSETNETIAMLEQLMKPLSEGVIVCNQNGNVLTVNPAVHRLFGIPSDTRQISLANLNGHNLRSSLIRAGLDTAGETEHHCETVMDFAGEDHGRRQTSLV